MRPDIFASAQNLLRRVGDTLLGPEPTGDDEAARARKRRRVVLVAGGGVLGACLVIYLLTHIGHGPARSATPPDTRQVVTVETLGTHAFEPRISLQGEARPRRDFRVYAPAAGVRLLQLLADEGDFVRAGQPLARLDTALTNAQLRQAQASVASAEAANRRAQDEYRRADSIRDTGALSTEAIDQRRAAAGASAAQLAAARAQLAETNARLQGGYVRAPAAGLVIQRTAEIGRPVDGQVLFRIAGDNALEVAAQVAEADVLSLRPGQRASFRLVDGTSVTATMRRGPAAIDSRTRTGQALFDLPRGTNVRAGMYLRGEAELAPRDLPAVQQASLLYVAGQAYIFIVEGETARRVPVQTGLREGDWVEVRGNVASDARVVGAGAAFLQNGDRVRAIMRGETASTTTTTPGAPLRGR